MSVFKPKFITFDCYGTLTRFQMSDMTRTIFADRIPAEKMDAFIGDFATYRLDEILGALEAVSRRDRQRRAALSEEVEHQSDDC